MPDRYDVGIAASHRERSRALETIGRVSKMGESKRRQEALGESYGKPEPIFPGLSISKETAAKFVRWTSRGAWAGIILMVVAWLTIRFIGPGFGWWSVID